MAETQTTAPAAGDAPTQDRPIFPLASFQGDKPPAPAWFDEALAKALHRWRCPCGGRAHRLAAMGRGRSGRAPGLIFVHGGLAHLGWWDFIAPFFSQAWTPMALSLSGMGDSDHRSEYRGDLYADEILAAAETAGLNFDHPDGSRSWWVIPSGR